MLYHCLPQAGNIYGANTRKAQLALQFSDIPFGEGLDDANYAMDGPMYYDDVAVPPFERVPAPTGLPDWATQAEVDYVVGEYERTGWEGGLEWYRRRSRVRGGATRGAAASAPRETGCRGFPNRPRTGRGAAAAATPGSSGSRRRRPHRPDPSACDASVRQVPSTTTGKRPRGWENARCPRRSWPGPRTSS